MRNFLSVVRRFKTAVVLNILGLSLAFAAFILIVMQLLYDWTFNRSVKQADCIYRVDLVDADRGQMAIISRPLAEAFIQSSPHIQAGMIWYASINDMRFTVERGGSNLHFSELSLRVMPSFPDVFALDMVEGDAHALNVSDQGLIPESMARKLFGSQSAIGQCLRSGEDCLTVGGVYRDFAANSSVPNCIYYPLGDKDKNVWNNWNYSLFIRVDNPKNASGLVDNFMQTQKEIMESLQGVTIRLEPLTGLHFSEPALYDLVPKTSWQTFWLLMTIALVIVVIASINYINFSISMTPIRIRSINTQKILGSPTGEIRRLLIAEAVVVALLSFALSLLWVHWAGDSFLAELVSVDMALTNHLPLLGVTALLALFTGLLAGIYPSFYMTSFQPALVLKGSFGLSPAGRKLRALLISIQYVASFSLIIAALFMYLQNRYMHRSSLGYDREQLIVCHIGGSKAQKRYEALREQLRHYSEIEAVTYANDLLSSRDQYMNWGREYHDKAINYQVIAVEPDFLRVMGISVTEGRDFRPEDALTAHGAYIFNESARKKYAIQLDAIYDTPIVGFMPDVKYASFRMEMSPMCFMVVGKNMFNSPVERWRWNNNLYVQVKAGSNLFAAMDHVEKTLRSFDGDYSFDVRLFDEVLDRVYRKEANMSRLIGLFSIVAVFISIVGVFGLVMFDSEYRRKEIGIRRVFGSSTRQMLIRFNRVYFRMLMVCFVIAVPPAWYGVDRWLENFAYQTPMYLWVYLVAFLLVALITIVTVTVQNWHAAHANPVDSIKSL